ncbi:hypothetical protein KY329_01835 [Candidatus Woesearchaeota archaeon]|nr:hypothetical protein [Candidatus Woesearchaeota archaeon]
MERGDSVLKVAVVSVVVICSIVAIVLWIGRGPTGNVVNSADFIGDGYGTVCEDLFYQCAGFSIPYFLGVQGYQVTCCCPEHYQGNGKCLRPKRVTL